MKINIKKIILAAIAIVSAVFPIRAEREYQSICKDNRVWIYSEYYAFRTERLQHFIYVIDGTTETNGNIYSNCYYYDYNNTNLTSPKLQAYLRQENGKVYMLSVSDSPYAYGFNDEDTLIYDFSLNPDEEFQVGEDKYYKINGADGNKYTMLLQETTDCGRIRCISVSDEKMGENTVRKLQMEFPAPPTKWHELYSLWEQYSKDETFFIQEGIGILSNTNLDHPRRASGTLPFPYYATVLVLNPPTMYNLLYVCDVEDINDIKEGNFGNVIYRQDGMPENPQEYFDALAVDEIRADTDAEPVYFNIQGMPVSNPTEGEIYIVKRGSKATKEVYRR